LLCGDPYTDRTRPPDNNLEETRALRLGDLFGIIDTDQAATSGQDHRRRDDRASQRAPSGFIQTGDTAIATPPGFQFKFVGRSHDVAPRCVR
jgi:hypothetical protein